MPGPVSDSYDPEFGTGYRCREHRAVVERIGEKLGPRKYINDVIDGDDGPTHEFKLTEREIRIIRFMLDRALESV